VHAVTGLEGVHSVFSHIISTSVVSLTISLFFSIILYNQFQSAIIIPMILTNLYHDSTTTKQIKALKAARATEMKLHTEAMKAVTRKYAKAIALAEAVRVQELEVGNNAVVGRYSAEEMDRVKAVLLRNRKKMTTVASNLLKKSIDKL